ncbi:MAG: tetratricopeptide repeat protein [Planctomycetota bacterium]
MIALPAAQSSFPAPALSRARLLGAALLLAALAFALYARTGSFAFVGIDDESYVGGNPPVTAGLTAAGVRWAFTAVHSSNWHPLTWLSHMLDVELFGLDAGAHHLVNAALHAAGTALAFLALAALTRQNGPSFVVAALFAVHPTHVESVAWIAERKDVLSGVSAMLVLLLWAGYARRPSAGRYAAVAAALALGLLAKPMLVTLPFVLLLLDLWPLGRGTSGGRRGMGRLVLEKLPLLALAAASSAVTFLVQSAGGATRSLDAVPLAARAANAAASVLAYLGAIFWPARLAVFYPHPAIVHPDRLGGLYLAGAAGALAIAALTWLAARSFRRAPYLLVGWLLFLGMLVPVSGLVQVGLQARADRYLYLPSLGLLVAAVWGAAELAARFRRAGRAPVLAAAAILGYGAAAWAQIGTWRDTRALCTHALAVTEENFLAHATLGNDAAARGDLEGARRAYEAALAIHPRHLDALSNLGATLMRLGRSEEGLARLRSAVALAPSHADARANLGRALLLTGDGAGAIAALEEAIRLAPDRPEPRLNLGLAHLARNELEAARAALEAAVRLDPGLALAHANLGGIAVVREEWDRAAAPLAAALRLNPENVGALYNQGLLEAHRGEAERARALFRRVLALAPGHAGAERQLQALEGR